MCQCCGEKKIHITGTDFNIFNILKLSFILVSFSSVICVLHQIVMNNNYHCGCKRTKLYWCAIWWTKTAINQGQQEASAGLKKIAGTNEGTVCWLSKSCWGLPWESWRGGDYHSLWRTADCYNTMEQITLQAYQEELEGWHRRQIRLYVYCIWLYFSFRILVPCLRARISQLFRRIVRVHWSEI